MIRSAYQGFHEGSACWLSFSPRNNLLPWHYHRIPVTMVLTTATGIPFVRLMLRHQITPWTGAASLSIPFDSIRSLPPTGALPQPCCHLSGYICVYLRCSRVFFSHLHSWKGTSRYESKDLNSTQRVESIHHKQLHHPNLHSLRLKYVPLHHKQGGPCMAIYDERMPPTNPIYQTRQS